MSRPRANGTAQLQPRTPLTPVLDAVALKLLLGFLENRHQTRYPLRLNLPALSQERCEIIVRMMAVAMLASGQGANQGRERLEAWLTRAAAGPRERALLDAALADPPPLSGLIDAVTAEDLGPSAYAAALAALDQRQEVDRCFRDYLAARLAIPSEIAISLAERYRL